MPHGVSWLNSTGYLGGHRKAMCGRLTTEPNIDRMLGKAQLTILAKVSEKVMNERLMM